MYTIGMERGSDLSDLIFKAVLLEGGDLYETRSLERTSLWHSAGAVFCSSTRRTSRADRHLGHTFWGQND